MLGNRDGDWKEYMKIRKTVHSPWNKREMRTGYISSEFGRISKENVQFIFHLTYSTCLSNVVFLECRNLQQRF